MSARTNRSTVCFLRNRGEVLLIRTRGVNGEPGRWDGVSDTVTDDPEREARNAVRSVVGPGNGYSLVRTGEPFSAEDGREGSRVLFPFLFECDSRAVDFGAEGVESEWVSPTQVRKRETAPGLQRAYERVAPTVETVAADTDHGSAWLSVSALAVLRDRAGGLTADDDQNDEPAWDDLVALAEALRAARPSMAVVRNRVNRAMAAASADGTAEALERAAIDGIERASEADAAAAREAAALLSGTVVTLSRSGTVLDALRAATDVPVIVGESRPAREGVGVAQALAADRSVTLAVDAALPHLLATRSIDRVLVGADAVLPDGSVVNKVGTRGLALAAAHEGIPVYAVTSSDKIGLDADPDFEEGAREAVYDGEEAIDVANPTFDRTPADAVTVVTEDGPLAPDDIANRADELAALADRTKDTSPDPE
ncbi:initiation factor 2B-related protein [Halococcus hamelinensis]|uniref:Initiation factor 2B-related protein n=1 Tax=Halococcus hamelinensis 100A6 TaxID=1132509 RepID=M0LYB6_9EURY|nr:initiation factor 2B-related protein [Halococcus hamelinensis]EMA38436.1 initiation factor 2B-related protein [Halococcus hamelinensis 100A6]